jgi:hypothetical protein
MMDGMMEGMGSMMTWMMGLGLLGWVLVIALLAGILVVLVRLLARTDRHGNRGDSGHTGSSPGAAHR